MTDIGILEWLNVRKKAAVNLQPLPISDAPRGESDGRQMICEGYPVHDIQFLDSEGSGSVVSGDLDDKKFGARFHCGPYVFVWVRKGQEQILDLVKHDLRLMHVDIV